MSIKHSNRIKEVADWIEFTPTWSGISTSSTKAYYKRFGDSIFIRAKATLSAAATGYIIFNLPNSYTIDSTKIDYNNYPVFGIVEANDSNAGSQAFRTGMVSMHFSYNTQLRFLADQTQSWMNATAPFTWESGDHISFFAEVPITELS